MSSKLNTKSPKSPNPPLIIPPLSPTDHTHTLICLHGRGSNGTKFSSGLLAHPITLPDSPPMTLQHHLPTTKFVFPTSPFRRAIFANRARITQWFDNYSVEPDRLEERPEIQIPGLRESIAYVHRLVEDEALSAGGVGKVVLVGLSLGACVAVMAALCWNGEEPLGAVVSMAGRMALRDVVNEAMGVDMVTGREVGGDEEDVIFEDEDEAEDITTQQTHAHLSPATRAVQALKLELDLPHSLTSTHAHPLVLTTPIFLGHGVHDEKVPVESGRESAACLRTMGCEVTWREYTDLGHWYHDRELADIVQFLKQKCEEI